ncbi:serine/threonine protein kinase, partial [bacterium]|nr:serine/threonine protein kinase [bacterium]
MPQKPEDPDPAKTQLQPPPSSLQPSGVSSSDARSKLVGAATEINPSGVSGAAGPRAAGTPGDAALPRIADVKLESSLGQGGMGAVYKGRQLQLDRAVAVKVIHAKLAKDESFLQRFEREAKVLAKLSHPNIVACYQAGIATSGEHFLLMEFVEGTSLAGWVAKHGPLSERDALVIGKQVAEGLEHALEACVVHRDVKPENILLKPVPQKTAGTSIGVQAKLVDLGLAGLAGPQTEATKITQAGTVVGTPVTMAPEQASDPDQVSHSWDIYALGCTLYFALTGKYPHEGKTIQEVLWKKLKDETPHPKRFRPDLADDVCQLILKIISFEKTKRPQTYEELIASFDALILARGGLSRSGERSPSVVLGGKSAAIAETTLLPRKAAQVESGSPLGKVALVVLAIAALGVGGLALSGKLSSKPDSQGTPGTTTPGTTTPGTTNPSTTAPSTADGDMKEPPGLPAGETTSLFGTDESLFSKWTLEPARGWKMAEEDGVADAVAEGAQASVAIFLKETPKGSFRLHGDVFPKSSKQLGARVELEDRSLDVSIQPLGEAVILKISQAPASLKAPAVFPVVFYAFLV